MVLAFLDSILPRTDELSAKNDELSAKEDELPAAGLPGVTSLSPALPVLWGEIRYGPPTSQEDQLHVGDVFDRVKGTHERSEPERVEIIDFRPEHADAFRQMNLDWITHYWEVEDGDRFYLDRPKERILDPGGAILMALYDGEVVGTVALIPIGEGAYELAKMAVDEAARGKGIGWRLGSAVLDRAREVGAKRVFLESNTILEPAINLYRKLGFTPVRGSTSPYDRCNIQMEVWLSEADSETV